MIVTIKALGHEWVRPEADWHCREYVARVPFDGYVAVRANCGYLLLARLEQVCDGPDAGLIRRVLVRADELPGCNVAMARTRKHVDTGSPSGT